MNQQHEYIGTRKLLIGIVLAVITFWLFANSLINVILIYKRHLAVI